MTGHRFDDITVESLLETGSMKWTRMPGHLAAFVAEMDFGTAPAVTQSLQNSADKALWGYLPPAVAKDMSEATSEFLQSSYSWAPAAGTVERHRQDRCRHSLNRELRP